MTSLLFPFQELYSCYHFEVQRIPFDHSSMLISLSHSLSSQLSEETMYISAWYLELALNQSNWLLEIGNLHLNHKLMEQAADRALDLIVSYWNLRC